MVGKKGKIIRARPSPPPFRAMPERNRFFLWEVFPKSRNTFEVEKLLEITFYLHREEARKLFIQPQPNTICLLLNQL